MTLIAGIGLIGALGVIANLMVAFQIRDRLDKITEVLEKK